MGKLRIQYTDMIDLLRRFLRALRMGDFLLYLEMLPYFAASGHNNYAKSAHVYIQDMIELVFDSYKSGPKLPGTWHEIDDQKESWSKGDVHSNHAPSVKKGKLLVKLGQ